MDTRLYHQLKKQELELQTKLTDVKRQLVEMEWRDFMTNYIERTASPQPISDDDIENHASPSGIKG
jgi:hypothetical protein